MDQGFTVSIDGEGGNANQPGGSDIRSGMILSSLSQGHPQISADSCAKEGNTTSEMLSSYATILQTITQQHQETMRTHTALLETVLAKVAAPPPRTRLSEVYIATFDPDGEIPVRDWCDHVNHAKVHWGLTDYEICTKVAGLLQGRAKSLGDVWLVKSATWADIRDALIQTFEPEARYSNDIVKFRNLKFDSADPAASITKAWNLWRRVMSADVDRDAVEAVIGCIDDERMRLRLLVSKCTTVPELISVASTMKLKESQSYERSAKRARLDKFRREDRVTCFKCGKQGHRQADCRNEGVVGPIKPLLSMNTEPVRSEKPKPICSYCQKVGHSQEVCFKRLAEESKKINFGNCDNSFPTPVDFYVGGRRVTGMFDSGAECSLIRRSVSGSIPGKRKDSVLSLRGLGGDVPVISYQYISVPCEFNTFHVNLDFYVVEDHEIPCGLIVGANLVKTPGVTVQITSTGASVTRTTMVMNTTITKNELFQKLDTDLTDTEEIIQLQKLLMRHREVFVDGTPSTKVTTGCLRIQLKDTTKIVSRRPYRMAPIERETIKRIVNELITNGIVRESTSEFASPVILVKKKNGEDRMCVDFRELNANTVPINFPLPLISDQIDKLSDAVYFISLDMAAGFHQIPIDEQSIHKTAFITMDGLFEYVMMPFGLMNAPAVYQKAIITALGHMLHLIQIYMDDVLIKCTTFSEGLQILDQVLVSLAKTGFCANVKKCSFFKRSIEYLGNVVCDGTVKPSPRKVEALEKSPTPSTVKQVRQFCGLAGYFRRFIPNFSERMIPLYNLTKKDAKWAWTAECENVRLDIIRRLTSAPVLMIFQEGLPIELHTDASSCGIGAVLIQIKNQRQHVVAYMSMRTTTPESHYHSYELETLAIIRAVKHFRHFLYGRHFKIITDCNAVKASARKHELLPRIHRWWAFLQHYDFEVEYRQGTRMKHADFFSRNPVACINLVRTEEHWLKVEQRRDADLANLIHQIEQGECVPGYKLQNDVLMKECKNSVNDCIEWRKIVPRSYQWSVINAYHTALKHFGWEKTLTKIREEYWFPEMSTTVRRFVDNCVICKTSKGSSGKQQVQLHPIEKQAVPFHTIHIDMTGRLTKRKCKYEYVAVVIDAYTKYTLLTYVTNKTSQAMLTALNKVVSLFGSPKQIISDQDCAFKAEFETFCKHHGIHQHFIAPGISRANGQIERTMAVVKNGLTIIRNYEEDAWCRGLDALQLAINCTKNRTTNVSPMQALTGRQGAVPSELNTLIDEERSTIDRNQLNNYMQKRMVDKGKADKERFDKGKAAINPFKKGDIVLLKTNPRIQIGLDLKYPDAYEVWKILPNDRYQVKRIFGKGRPKKVAHDQLRPAPKPGLQDTVSAKEARAEKEESQNKLTSNKVDCDEQPGPSN